MTTNQFEAAKARGEERLRGPRASSAHYDAGRDRVIVRLTTGVEIGFAPRDAEGLQHATREDLAEIEVEALGRGIHFPRLDADLYVPALLEGVLGSKSWMAARLGAAGGRVRCGAKAAASRDNGKRGGPPRKTALARGEGGRSLCRPAPVEASTHSCRGSSGLRTGTRCEDATVRGCVSAGGGLAEFYLRLDFHNGCLAAVDGERFDVRSAPK